MATITGLKLSELSSLILGSTGTLFYAATASASSYKITERDLYNTLNILHISGAYQPKNEDWRFVHKTGTENITGTKNFATNIGTRFINDYTGEDLAIHVDNRKLHNSSSSTTVDWQNKYLYSTVSSVNWGDRLLSDDDENITLDWQNRRLTGNWVLNNEPIVTGNKVVYTTGNQTISGIKTFSNAILIAGTPGLYLSGSTIYYGAINTSPKMDFSTMVLYDDDGLPAIDWATRYLHSTTSLVTLDWASHTLIGSDSTVSLNWDSKTLISGWKANDLTTFKLILSGSAPSTPTSAGVSGQIAMSGQKLFLATGTNKWGYVSVTPW